VNKKSEKIPQFRLPSPELNFLASKNNLYDYENLYGFTLKLSKELSAYDISEKQPLAILSKSSDELIFIIGACFLLNIPIAAISPGSTDAELTEKVKSINPACFITDTKNSNRISDHPVIIPDKKWLKLKSVPNVKQFSLEKPESVLGYFFTSGSTGSPKIVPLKRRQIFFAAEASAENFKPDKNRYWLLCLPLNHIGGISIILRSILYHSAIYRMDKFDEHQVRTFLFENKLFQVASLVPTMLIRLLEDPLFQVHLEFKAILLGGGPISLQLINESSVRGIPIVSSYGMTETCAQIAANPMLKPSGLYHPKSSVGMIFKPNRVEIRDPETGQPLAYNNTGLIWLHGPQVFDGYTDSKINEKVFDKDGWFNTGDYGKVNKQEQLFIQNRRTDLIVTGGENVNPSEIEELISDQEGISESAVFGIKDAYWGEKIIAFIVPENGNTPDEKLIKKYLSKKLSSHKIPKEFYIIDSLPKTDMEKVRRSELPELYSQLTSDI